MGVGPGRARGCVCGGGGGGRLLVCAQGDFGWLYVVWGGLYRVWGQNGRLM